MCACDIVFFALYQHKVYSHHAPHSAYKWSAAPPPHIQLHLEARVSAFLNLVLQNRASRSEDDEKSLKLADKKLKNRMAFIR